MPGQQANAVRSKTIKYFSPRRRCSAVATLVFGLTVTGLTLTASCSGTIESPASGGGPGVEVPGGKPNAPGTDPGKDPAVPSPSDPTVQAVTQYAPARVRRLNFEEIQNAAHDIFLTSLAKTPALPASLILPSEKVAHEFDTQFDRLTVSSTVAEALQQYAEWVASQAVAARDDLHACDWNQNEESCVRSFIAAFGPQVWRRPLSDDESAMLWDFYHSLRAAGGGSNEDSDINLGLRGVVEALLQAPSFLFRTELGQAQPATEHYVVLTPHEIASAMAFFLWRSTPDQPLLDAAVSGALATPEGRGAEARRMLNDARAKASLRAFATQWLEVDGLRDLLLSEDRYPNWNSSWNPSLLTEVEKLIDDVLWSEEGYRGLLTAPFTFADPTIAKLYGQTAPADGNWVLLPLDPKRRSGVLTQPGFLASHHPPADFSPIFLGHFVRTRMLCQSIPDPVGDVPQLPTDPNLTARERFNQHASDGSCRGCHQFMDPIGFGFERFDALAQWRSEDRGSALTGSGNLTGTDMDGDFVDPVGLGQRLAMSDSARDCFVGQLFSYASGRPISMPAARLEIDDVAVEQALARFAQGNGNVPDLLVTIVASESFVRRDHRQLVDLVQLAQ